MKEEVVTLGDVTEATVDKSGPSGSSFIYVDIGSIDREKKIISETNVVESEAAPSRAKQVLQNGDVLVSMTRPNLNAVALVTPEFHGAIGSTGFHVLRSKWVEPKFLFYLVQTRKFIDEMCLCVQGALYPAVRPKDISSFAFFLPSSLPAQRAIVAKIEELFSELDKGIENLKTAQAQLKVYRQALLKHAFEGKLTAAWREQNRDQLETAAALQQRIQQERAQRYQQQLADWEANSKQGSKPKAPKPLPPLTADELAELPGLPEGWGWFSMGDICQEAVLGKMLDKEKNKGELRPYLRNINVRWGKFALDDLLEMRFEEFEYPRYGLEHGDLVICEGGEPGRCAVWRQEFGQGIQIQKALHRVRFTNSIYPSFVQMYFELCASNRRLEKMFTGTTIKHLTGERLERMAVPACSVDEQAQIILMLEAKFSEIDQLDQTLATSLQQAEALRQSILKRAFSGQLVPQDPHDEPASALLARIKAEQEKSSPSRKTGRSK